MTASRCCSRATSFRRSRNSAIAWRSSTPAASSTRVRSAICAARAAPATGCAPTDDARALEVARRQPGIEHAPAGRARHRLPGRGAARRRALARARAQAGVGHPLADAGACDARGPVLPPHRDAERRTAEPPASTRAARRRSWSAAMNAAAAAPGARRARRSSRRRPSTLDRLPLGAAQAACPRSAPTWALPWRRSCR